MSIKSKSMDDIADRILLELDLIETKLRSVSSENIKKKYVKLKIAMNKIAIIGSGPDAYTRHFTEKVNGISRTVLSEVSDGKEKNKNQCSK